MCLDCLKVRRSGGGTHIQKKKKKTLKLFKQKLYLRRKRFSFFRDRDRCESKLKLVSFFSLVLFSRPLLWKKKSNKKRHSKKRKKILVKKKNSFFSHFLLYIKFYSYFLNFTLFFLLLSLLLLLLIVIYYIYIGR